MLIQGFRSTSCSRFGLGCFAKRQLNSLFKLLRRFKIRDACLYSVAQRLMVFVALGAERALLKVALDLYVANQIQFAIHISID